MQCCPNCGYRPPDAIEQQVSAIRQWAATNGISVVMGDKLRQCHAARYLGRSQKTLMNWPAHSLPVHKSRGRNFVEIQALARFVVEQDFPKVPAISR